MYIYNVMRLPTKLVNWRAKCRILSGSMEWRSAQGGWQYLDKRNQESCSVASNWIGLCPAVDWYRLMMMMMMYLHKPHIRFGYFLTILLEDSSYYRLASDINPIEHIWYILNRKTRKHTITNKNTLLAAFKEEWQQLFKEECFKLVESMPKRVAAVIQSKTGRTIFFFYICWYPWEAISASP